MGTPTNAQSGCAPSSRYKRLERRTSLALLALALTVTACQDIAAPRMSQRGPSRDFEPCPIEGPIPDGCPLPYSDSNTEQPFASYLGPATGSEPVWSGGELDYANSNLVCGDLLFAPLFTIFVPDYGSDVQFASDMNFLKQMDLPSTTVLGITVPRARYYVPAGPIYSVRPLGQYEASGGTIDVTCFAAVVRTLPGGQALALGKNIYSNYTGQILRNQPGGGGSTWEDGRGWASENDGEVTGTGTASNGFSAELAISRLTQMNECTVGWEIWIDGRIACFADGSHGS
jgi:hypothetical protein